MKNKTISEAELTTWLDEQGKAWAEGKLSAERTAALDKRIPGWSAVQKLKKRGTAIGAMWTADGWDGRSPAIKKAMRSGFKATVAAYAACVASVLAESGIRLANRSVADNRESVFWSYANGVEPEELAHYALSKLPA